MNDPRSEREDPLPHAGEVTGYARHEPAHPTPTSTLNPDPQP